MWQLWQFVTTLTISDNFDNFWQLWQFQTTVTISDNFDKSRELWLLRHWLQFWQLRTWILDNLCYLTIKSDTGQHSQFLRCFRCTCIILGGTLFLFILFIHSDINHAETQKHTKFIQWAISARKDQLNNRRIMPE